MVGTGKKTPPPSPICPAMTDLFFWRSTPLAAMTDSQWESLCDGCGKCCLNKLEDEDTGDIHYTRVACQLLDLKTCRCTDYANRKTRVPDCLDLRELAADDFKLAPNNLRLSPAYRAKRLTRLAPPENRQAGFGTQSKLFGPGSSHPRERHRSR